MSRLHRARAAMLAALSAEPKPAEPAARPAATRKRPRRRTEKAEVFGGFVERRAA
jgi:hypothetical protein